jgi:glycosyltransferase involved in cell wall biosynthesis
MTATRSRLLVLTPTFPYPPTSGGDIRVFHLLRRLSRSFEIHLLSRGSGDSQQLIDETGISAVHLCQQTDIVTGSSNASSRIDFWRYAPHGISLKIESEYAAKLTRLVADFALDGVIIDHLYMMQYVRFLKSLPVFYCAHNVETTKFARWYGTERLNIKRRVLYWAQERVIRWQESRLGTRSRVAFATSQIDRDLLARMNCTGRFVVVPNGVDLDYFRPRLRESFDLPPAVFFVGTMYYKPNHDAAVFLAREVFPRVRLQIPDAICHLAGKTGERDYSALNHPDEGVRMHGFVEDIRAYLEQTQVLVVPLFAGSGTRIKILEAMASGTPVVSTSIGAEGLDYSNEENIVIADTAADMAASVVALLRDRERCFRIGRAGRRLVEQKYSWDASADVMRAEIARVLVPVSGRGA